MTDWFGFILIVAIIFGAGFAWGQWFAERNHRLESAGRIVVSMPADPAQASAALGMLKRLMDEAGSAKVLPQQEQK